MTKTPAPAGAADADAGGQLVTYSPRDLAAITAAGTASGTPTWAAVNSLAHAQLAEYAKGRVRENVNEYTKWYYGDSTAAPFCFIFISWVLAHAGSSSAAGLALIGGKKAYVPNIDRISGYRAGHSGVKAGAIAAINGFGHIGFVSSISGSSFNLLSGNSTQGASDDAVTVKTYPLSAINGYVNLAYASGPTPAPQPKPSITVPSGSPVLKNGSTGTRVKQLQAALNHVGAKLTVDGAYGPKTTAAVKTFQAHHGLAQDGEYGPKTAAALAKAVG
jgi:hypothetical protein